MIPNQAVDSFVVGDGVFRSELDDDLLVAIPGQCASGFIEEEDVAGVCVELKISF